MIGTTGATLLAIVNVIVAGVLGIVAGGITCAIERRRWTLRAVGTDAVLAMVAVAIAAYGLATIAEFFGVWHSVILPAFAISTTCVVLRHVVGPLKIRG